MSFTFLLVSRCTLLRQLLRDKIESTLLAHCIADCGNIDEIPSDLPPIDLALVDADDAGVRPFAALHSFAPARCFRFDCFLTTTRGSFLAHCVHRNHKLRGIIHSFDGLEEAMRSISDIARGAVRVSRQVDQIERRQFAGLISPREIEHAEAFAYGVSSEEVAARFGLSPATVRTHRRNLMYKLEAHNQTELIRFARGSGIVPLREFLHRSEPDANAQR